MGRVAEEVYDALYQWRRDHDGQGDCSPSSDMVLALVDNLCGLLENKGLITKREIQEQVIQPVTEPFS